MDQAHLIVLLRARIDASSAAAVARELDISESTLSLILHGKRKPGPKVARALGYEPSGDFKPISVAPN